MFNAERLLGGLIQGALSGAIGNQGGYRRRRHRGSSLEGAIGMGLVGLAIGAFEHYANQSQTAGANPAMGSGGSFQPGAISPPPNHAFTSPPPAPSGAKPPPPPPPGGGGAAGGDRQAQSLLLIRAMLSAAAADSQIDSAERQRILGQVQALGLGDDATQYIESQMAQPLSLAQLLQEVRFAGGGAELNEQVYLASLLAIQLDSDAEKNHLQALANGLGLSADRVSAIHAQFGVSS